MTDWTNELFTAIRENDHTTIQNAVLYGADINARSNNGNTPLMEAAYHGHTACLQYLINEGANVNDQNNFGSDALSMAAFNGYTDCMKSLLICNANPDRESELGYTPLMFAVISGHEETVEFLLEHGANPEFCTKAGKTAASEAQEVGGAGAKDIQDIINAAIAKKHSHEQEQDKKDLKKSLTVKQKQRQIGRRRLVRSYTKKKFGP